MTLQELSTLIGYSEFTIRNTFTRTQQKFAKQGIYISKTGSYPNTNYVVTYSDYWSIPEVNGFEKKPISAKIKEDLTGKAFGRLTVLYCTNAPPSNHNSDAFWLCQCNCKDKNYVVMSSSHLKTNPCPSCGCYNRDRAIETHCIDLTGQRFGNLTVLYKSSEIERTPDGKAQCANWVCQCDCGSVITTRGTSLRNGHTSSCGCLLSKGEQLIGEMLSKNNIIFEKQKTFENCRFTDSNNKARFDFYLPEYNCLIEYDGLQHFLTNGNNRYSKEELQALKERDMYKNNWALQNEYILIRIPYTHYNFIQIEDLLPGSKFTIK